MTKRQQIFNEMKDKRSEAPLRYGPLPLNLASAELSEIITELLQGKKPAVFSYSKKDGLAVQIGDKTHNISLLLETADLSQLMIDRAAMENYSKILVQNKDFKQPYLPNYSRMPTEQNFRNRDQKNDLENLSYAEMLAINIYTTEAYDQINNFLRGSMRDIDTAAKQSQKSLNTKATELLLACCLAASGLNRARADSKELLDETVRIDLQLPRSILDQRIKAVKERQGMATGITPISAFTSSSYQERGLHSEAPVHTMFYNLQGKKVTAISSNPQEREFLIPPTQIQWTAAETQDSVVYLMGRPVNTPDSVRDARIIEKHTEFAKDIDEINMALQSDKKTVSPEISSLLGENTKLAEDIRQANATTLFSSDLSRRVQSHRRKVAVQIGSLINDDIEKTMRELQSAAEYKLKAPSWISNIRMKIMGSNALLDEKNAILLRVKNAADELLKKTLVTPDDITKLSTIVNLAINDHNKLLDRTNQNRNLFTASAGETGKILDSVLSLVRKMEPGYATKPLLKPQIAPIETTTNVAGTINPTEIASEFDSIVIKYLTTRCSDSDHTYENFKSQNDLNPIYRVKHGGMHASRATLNASILVDLLKMNGYQQAQALTSRDKYLIEVAVMFHDTGRRLDSGNDQKSWEEDGAKLCAQYLRERGYTQNEIDKVQEAIAHKDDSKVQEKNVYALVVAASDSLDWGRSHGSDINTEYLPTVLRSRVPQEVLTEFAKRCKLVAKEQGDSPRSQFGIASNFNIETKKTYEHSGECYSKTKILHDRHFLGFEEFCRSKLPSEDKPEPVESKEIPTYMPPTL